MKARRLTPAEGQRLQRIVRRCESKQGENVVRWRRATIMLASARDPREVIHRFN